jgi:opacity protein-like surface antigen
MIFEDVTYEYDFSTAKFAAMVTFNYHFVNTDVLDVYGMAGAGYKNRNFTFSSTDPNYIEETISGTLIPVSLRVGLGMRYFFTDNIGLNLALGLGQGGIINGGFTVKF